VCVVPKHIIIYTQRFLICTREPAARLRDDVLSETLSPRREARARRPENKTDAREIRESDGDEGGGEPLLFSSERTRAFSPLFMLRLRT
jgi:hypothetical protein